MRSVNIFSRSKNENGAGPHLLEQVYCPLDVRAKTRFGVGRILARIGGEMNHRVIVAYLRGVERVKNVELRTAREIIGLKEIAHVRAEIAAAAGY
jgi:hypothetical protein